MKILMVCLGNICRSPLAEGIMRKRAAEAGLDWEIGCCGISAGNQCTIFKTKKAKISSSTKWNC